MSLRGVAAPVVGESRVEWDAKVDSLLRLWEAWHVEIDSTQFTGTDTNRMNQAMAFVQAEDTAGRPMPWIRLPHRAFNTGTSTFAMFSGLKILGNGYPIGPNNIQINQDFPNGYWRTSCGSLGSSLLQSTSQMYGIKMVGITFYGDSTSQIFRSTVNTYACEFFNLFFYGVKHAIGAPSEKYLMTQMIWGGHWGFSSSVDTLITWGGGDCSLWMGASFANMDLAANGGGKPHIIFSSCSKTEVGKIYSTNRNDWIGLQILGDVTRDVAFYGGEYEGVNPSTPSNYPVIDIQGGMNIFYSPKTGQVGTSAQGVVRQSGGVAIFYSPTYRRSDTVTEASLPWLYQTGGVARVNHPLVLRTGEQMRIRWSSGTTEVLDEIVNGVSIDAPEAVNAAATDAATTQALVNSIRTALIAKGIAV